MDTQTLCSVLQAGLSPDPTHRSQAEQALKQYQYAPRQAVNLLQLVVHAGVDLGVRQAASIQFKQTVAKAWEPKEKESARLGDDDKAVIRANMLEAIIQSPPLLRSQLGETLRAIVDADYPERWPDLLSAVGQNVSSPDHSRVYGALYALRLLARKYEFKDEEERQPVQHIVHAAFPTLLSIFNQIVASPAAAPEAGEILKLVGKTFWSCTFLEIPDHIAQPEVFQAWLVAFHSLIVRPVPAEGQPTDPEQRRQWSWWKCKKWALHVVNRMYNRYGDPRMLKKDRRPLAHLFTKQYAPRFMEAYIGLLGSLAQGQYLPDRVTNLLLQYVTTAVQKKEAYRQMKPHLPVLVYRVVFPLLCFSEEDAQLWQEDPHEYVRKGYDIIEDMYSPRTAAMNFVAELVRVRPKENLHTFLGHLVQVFTQCAPTVPVEQRPLAQLDGAMLAIGSLADKLKGSVNYRGSVETMLTRHIVPEFRNPRGHIRAKACWVSGQFSDVQFADAQSFNTLFRLVVGCLADPELPVRVDAVIALRNFVEATEDLSDLRSILPQLLNELFKLMNEVENEDLVFTLETIVEKFGEEISPYAVGLTQNLVAAFWKCINSEDESDDDVGALASVGCLRAIATVLESVSSLPHLYPQLEAILMPVLTKMLTTDGQDVFEEVLELVSYITYFGPGVSQQMWQLWPLMVSAVEDWALQYFENVMVPMDNYISRGTEVFLGSQEPNCQQQVFRIVQRVLNDPETSDGDAEAAPKLIGTVLQNCRGRVDEWVEPYLVLALERFQRAERRGMKDLLMVVLANALYYNPVIVVNCLVKRSALSSTFGVWMEMLGKLTEKGKRAHFKRENDKKMCVLGIVSLVVLPADALPLDLRAGMPALLRASIQLLSDLKAQVEERERKEAEEEKEGDDEDEDELDNDEDKEEEDFDDEGDAAGEEHFLSRMAKGFSFGMGDDDSDSDWGWDDDDDEVSSPVDAVDPFVYFADAFAATQQADPERFAQITQGLEQSATAAAYSMLQHAQVRREAMAKEEAEKAAKAQQG